MLWCFVKKCVKDIKIVETFNHSFWKKKDVWKFVESNCSQLPERETMAGIAKFCQKNKMPFFHSKCLRYYSISWTTEAQWSLFTLKSRTFGLGKTNWADKFWSIWGFFGRTISTHFGIYFWYSKSLVHVFHYSTIISTKN